MKERGLEGVKLVISDSHNGLKAAIQQVFCASWQRCRYRCKTGPPADVNLTHPG
ncbi:transposase [Candidatus Erwinia dacicola]